MIVDTRNENLRFRRLLDTASALNSSLDIQHLLPLIIISARDLLDAEASSLFLLDKKHDFLYCEVAIGEKGKLLKQYLRLEMGEGIAGWVAQNKKPILLKDAYEDSRFDQSWDKISGFQTRSVICIPIYIKEKFIGTLEVMNKRNNEVFDETDLETLEYLGNIAAVALDNARLHEGLMVKVRELALLTELEKKISSGRDFDQLLDWTLARTMEVLQAKGGSVLLLTDDKNTLVVKSSVGFIRKQITSDPIPANKGIVGLSITEKRPVLIKNLNADKRLHGEPIQSHESSSMLCAPLRWNDEFYGVILINDKIDDFSFSREDLESLNNVTERLSMLLRTAHAFDRMKEVSREQESASKIMEKILPTSIPVIPGLDIYARYLPYNQIGGDFYRFFEFDDNRLGILVVDVSGHGFPAALISVMVNTLISAMPLNELSSPARFFNCLNTYLIDRLNGNFLTGIYLIIDREKNIVQYANAGHCDLVLSKADDNSLKILNAKGPLLGVWKDPLLEEREVIIGPDDRLVIFTDGLLEIYRDKSLPVIDEKEILVEFQKHIKKPAHQFTDLLVQYMMGKSSIGEFSDDVTMIIVDVKE